MEEIYINILKNLKDGKISKDVAVSLLTQLKQIENEDKNSKIAIVGMAGRFPEADNLDEFWDNLINAKESIREFPENRRRDVENYIKVFSKTDSEKLRIAGYLNEIDKFDYGFFGISPKEAELMDPNQRILLENVIHTIEDAGITLKELEGSDTGVYIGYSIDFGTEYKKLINVVDTLDAFAATGNTYSVLAGRISYLLDLMGPAMVIDTACSSSLVALNKACDDLRNGACSKAIVGSAKVVPILGLTSELEFGVGSSTERTFPFDDRSDGIAFGEGVGSVLLKRLDCAIKDNDRIYAVIDGGAVNQDGRSMALTAPNPLSQAQLILKASQNSKVNLKNIGYFETHGTGTKLGDPIEIEGITMAFSEMTDKKQFCPIGSVKANIGHLDCAAGIASLIKCSLQLKNKMIAPSINFEVTNKNIDFINSPVYINYKAKKWDLKNNDKRRCCISSFSVGGTNSHIILEEYDEDNDEGNYLKNNEINLLTLSAKDGDVLYDLFNSYIKYIEINPQVNILNMCYTANRCREDYDYRAVILFKDMDELREKLLALVGKRSSDTLKGIYLNETKEMNKCNLDDVIEKYIKSNFEDYSLAEKIAEGYVNGSSINWDKLYSNRKIKKIKIPLYPFKKNRCWVDFRDECVQVNTKVINNIEEKPRFKLLGKDNFSKVELDIGKCFYDLLGVNNIKFDDSFFELGGNSILAIKFELEMKKMQYEFSYKDLKDNDTIEKISSFLSSKENENISGNTIKGIEPFNDIFFKDCFYNSLFPIIYRNGKNIEKFMLNEYTTYKIENDLLNLSYNSILDFDYLCNKENIKFKKYENVDNVLESIEKSIKNNKFVIIFIDCFYESFRKDTYKKLHWPHTLLLYGVDPKNKKINAIEHKNKDNLRYSHYILDYKDVEDSYYGFKNNFEGTFKYTFFEIDSNIEKPKEANVLLEELEKLAISNIQIVNKKMTLGITCIEEFKQYFEKMVNDKKTFMNNVEKLTSNFNNIINIKKAELYKYEKLPKFKVPCNILKNIIESWEKIREAFCYCMFSNKYMSELLIEQPNKLEEIFNLEKRYVEELKTLI